MPRATRREFMKTASAGAVASMTALNYARAQGANDRISIGIIGCGGRGFGAHMPGVHRHAAEQNIEITAVCDPWRLRREEAAARAHEWYGCDVRQFSCYQDLLALDDVDAVMIASCDHQHTTHLKAAARAKKDIYVEKPLAMDFNELKSSCDAVKESGAVVQVGTQLRSLPSMTGARELVKTGILGTISRVEQCRNSPRPYWYGYMKDVNEADVDWKEFLMDRKMRPFDPVQYSGWYGYLDFSDGPVPGLGSHFIDLVHYITGATYPTSAVGMEGVFTWKDENHFTCPDHVQVQWTYPEGFMVSYVTNFGSGAGNTFKIIGDRGVIDLANWNAAVLSGDGAAGDKAAVKEAVPVEDVDRPDHFLDWLQCMRTRGVCNAPIEAGYQHAVATLMAVRATRTGRRQVYDAQRRIIRRG